MGVNHIFDGILAYLGQRLKSKSNLNVNHQLFMAKSTTFLGLNHQHHFGNDS